MHRCFGMLFFILEKIAKTFDYWKVDQLSVFV